MRKYYVEMENICSEEYDTKEEAEDTKKGWEEQNKEIFKEKAKDYPVVVGKIDKDYLKRAIYRLDREVRQELIDTLECLDDDNVKNISLLSVVHLAELYEVIEKLYQ